VIAPAGVAIVDLSWSVTEQHAKHSNHTELTRRNCVSSVTRGYLSCRPSAGETTRVLPVGDGDGGADGDVVVDADGDAEEAGEDDDDDDAPCPQIACSLFPFFVKCSVLHSGEQYQTCEQRQSVRRGCASSASSAGELGRVSAPVACASSTYGLVGAVSAARTPQSSTPRSQTAPADGASVR
jgi:hypothetical protein